MLAISRPPSPSLLELDNMSTNLPTGLHLNGIDRLKHLPPCLMDRFTKVAKQ
ncbi:hypothetical protein J3D47_000177 [Pseudomonas laurylsulfativorans]|nr:hypothetical protein [Pseudomonas laurylsulfativorans]